MQQGCCQPACARACACDTQTGSLTTSGSVKANNYLSEAVIGSLPKGLTQEAKSRIAQSVPMSPASQALKEINMVRDLCMAERCLQVQQWERWPVANTTPLQFAPIGGKPSFAKEHRVMLLLPLLPLSCSVPG